ncbi:uncharacterized protein F4822DRAFT_392803 [Hypoxylon trugodes]|uniref:uncharacterized protein n=1 Tax=Hypoxylon trugodes TaxID=326681 RepID=UPI00218DE7A6|nr:uncharacterized protein F4822DRAFT_392803 [Hypoxylon trugodes]KAI1393002.1 hypothetical protein F4822DRAFT_392803 [Hypoxylon trugodes]
MSSSLDNLYLLSPEEQQAILNSPALAPPQDDIIPNFESPPNMNRLGIYFTTIALSVVTIAIFLRAYVKVAVMKQVQIQDYIAVLAYGAFIGYCYSLYQLVGAVGLLAHQWNFLVRDMSEPGYIFVIATNFYIVDLMFIKTSIIMDWVWIFAPRGTRGGFFWSYYGTLCFNFLYYLSCIIARNLTCIPIKRIWDKTIPGKCFDTVPLNLVSAIVNLVCDLVILVAPQRIIWRLQLTRWKRAGISIIFAIGLITIAGAISQTIIVIQASPDFIFMIGRRGLVGLAELTFSLLLFCVPVIPKAFKELRPFSRLMHSVRPSTSRSMSGSSSGWRLRETSNNGRGYNCMVSNETSLTNPNPVRLRCSGDMDDIQSNENHDGQTTKGGITRTMQFTMQFTAIEERR